MVIISSVQFRAAYDRISAISTVTLSFWCELVAVEWAAVPLSLACWLRFERVEVADALLLPREPRREPAGVVGGVFCGVVWLW